MQLPVVDETQVQLLVDQIKQAKRPVFWIGGGALNSVDEIKAIADLGIPVVSSTHGRGILPDAHPRSLGAFHNSAKVEELLKNADLLVVVGSRLRSNETKTYSVQFPENIVQIDANPVAQQRNYKIRHFICSDAKDILSRSLIQLNVV